MRERLPDNKVGVSGILTKGNGEASLMSELNYSLSCGGGQAGQGSPRVLAASFSAGAGASAGTIGYAEEVAPTLKGSPSGNCMPSVMCLHDPGRAADGCVREYDRHASRQRKGASALGV